MTTYTLLDSTAATVYFDAEGAGTSGDPYQPRSADSAAILAKLSDNPATSTLQGAGNDSLAALEAAINADPPTATLQGTGNDSLAAIVTALADQATQVTLAAVLAKLSADPSTATLQGTANSSLADIKTAVEATLATAEATKTISFYSGTAATSGDNTIIAAPGAGVQIVISQIMVQNESDVATTAIVKDGATGIWRSLHQYKGSGLTLTMQQGREWRLTANTALVLNLSGANSHGVSVAYWTE